MSSLQPERAASKTRGRSENATSPAPAGGTLGGEIFSALMMLVVLTVITGVVYPLLITGIAQAVFPARRTAA